MTEKRKRGRPPYPAEERRVPGICLWVTEAERDAVKNAARRRQMNVGEYLRHLVAADTANSGTEQR